MQLLAITEIIHHFAGYLHIAVDPDRDWLKPDGAPHDGRHAGSDALRIHHIRNFDPPASDPQFGRAAPDSLIDFDPHLKSGKSKLHGHVHPAHKAFIHQQPLPPIPVAPPVGGDSSGGDMASGSNWHGADQAVVDVHQVNMLIGDNILVDHMPVDHIASAALPSDAPLPDLIAQAYAVTPANAPVLGLSDSQEIGVFKTYEDGFAKSVSLQSSSLTAGTHVDGMQTSSDGTPATVTLPVSDLASVTPPTEVPFGQTVILGHDIAGNAALIEDTSAAPLTTIVEGNVYHTNLIVQANVIQNIDTIASNGMDPNVIAPGADSNTAHNTAHFEQLPYVISTNVSGGLAQSWNVQIVNGDFYDVNAVTQQNVLINDTLYVGTPTTDHYYAVLGGNTQLNAFSLTHDAPSYDLLIVLGNAYTGNAIYQQNVLLNDTTLGLTVNSDGGAENQMTLGHNTATNEASIAEYGQTQWAATTSGIQALVQSLETSGNQAAPFEGLSTMGTTINVMIVTGNYYDLNLISQTNVISNSNKVLADFTGAGSGTPITLTAGQNQLTNSATIITAGALSNQYVGGTAYDTATLVQTNIISTHATVSSQAPNALVPELVAFLDTGHPSDGAGTAPGISAPVHAAIDASHHDILSGTTS